MTTEQHPLSPFLPAGARVLMLGSFPPKRERWSMEFFYPNWLNDMWRIVGHIFFVDKHHFELSGEKRFDKAKIEAFCREKGIALYDGDDSRITPRISFWRWCRRPMWLH